MRTFYVFIAVVLVLLLCFAGCERKTTTVVENTKIISPSSANYIGSAECGICHVATYTSFMNSGHPYKLNEAEDAQVAGYYPYTTLPSPPPGVAWEDVDKVIGGFRWKARFIDNDGYIITGSNVQYNFADSSWTAYHDGEIKPYDCGPCHMTGYKDTGNQEGKAGLVGTWAFGGIQCEECHGPGELHAADPYEIGLVIDRSTEQCGKCHIRGDENKIPASGGFIKHHEQWNEMFTTKHNALKCVDCHDPHIGLHPLNPERSAAIKINCENCHLDEAESFEKSSINHAGSSVGPDCIDCHMARAAKSAVAAGPYEGDIRSHLVRINTDADAEMFTPDGSYANGYLTLEYTCLTCHSDKNKSWAADNASRVHGNQVASITDCFSCHNDATFGLVVTAIQEQYGYSVHASGNNTNRNRNYQSYYAACEKCHTSEGFIADVTGVPASGEHFSAINCFTCHEPHTDGTFGHRVESAVTLGNGTSFDRGEANICASCHQSRRDVNTYVVDSVSLSTYWSPHYSNQSDMLMGTNAYEYTGYTYASSAHTDVAADACVDCHMSSSYHSSIGGHSWNMHNEDTGYKNLGGCNISTCHNGDITDFDHNSIQTDSQVLLDSLLNLLVAANLADTAGTPISRIVATADSAGALYNYLYVYDDRSLGVHNTDYALGLLRSSINYLNTGDPNGIIRATGFINKD